MCVRIGSRYAVFHRRNWNFAGGIAMKRFAIVAAVVPAFAWGLAAADNVDQPDGLQLPSGFHATVVAEGLGPIRHMAVRGNGDIYVSTPINADATKAGIIALRLDAAHKAEQVQHFGAVDGGTGIRFYKGALYASTASSVYRFTFDGNALVPANA